MLFSAHVRYSLTAQGLDIVPCSVPSNMQLAKDFRRNFLDVYIQAQGWRKRWHQTTWLV